MQMLMCVCIYIYIYVYIYKYTYMYILTGVVAQRIANGRAHCKQAAEA